MIFSNLALSDKEKLNISTYLFLLYAYLKDGKIDKDYKVYFTMIQCDYQTAEVTMKKIKTHPLDVETTDSIRISHADMSVLLTQDREAIFEKYSIKQFIEFLSDKLREANVPVSEFYGAMDILRSRLQTPYGCIAVDEKLSILNKLDLQKVIDEYRDLHEGIDLFYVPEFYRSGSSGSFNFCKGSRTRFEEEFSFHMANH